MTTKPMTRHRRDDLLRRITAEPMTPDAEARHFVRCCTRYFVRCKQDSAKDVKQDDCGKMLKQGLSEGRYAKRPCVAPS